jgi:DNA-directed RNA polymerase subunit H (RpoH/RPB5)
MIARVMGLAPGDIVKITRPSPSAGEYVSYRICVP